MKVGNKHLKAGSLYLIGNLFNNGIAFLTIPIFTRILSTYDYGIINTYSSWAGIFSMILGMTLHMAIRAAFIDYEEKIDGFMSSITVLTLVSTVIISTLIFTSIIVAKIDIKFTLVALCLIQGFSSAIISNYSMYLMMKYKYKARTLLLILPNLVTTIVSLIAILYVFESNKYLGKIIPSSLTSLIIAIVLLALIFNKKTGSLTTKYWKYALGVSLPMILHGLSLNILGQSDRIMLTALVGASETGVYSLIYNFSMIANVVVVSLAGVWVPWFTQKMKNREIELINEKVKLYIRIMTVVIVSIILISPEVLRILAPKEYWHGEMIIPPIIISSYIIFIYTLYVNVEHFHKKTRHIAVNTIIAASSNIVLNLIFIPRYGMYAASLTTLVSYSLSLYLHYKYSRKIEEELFPIKIIMKYLLVVLIATGGFYLISGFATIRWGLFVILSLSVIIKFKSKVIKFIKTKNID